MPSMGAFPRVDEDRRVRSKDLIRLKPLSQIAKSGELPALSASSHPQTYVPSPRRRSNFGLHGQSSKETADNHDGRGSSKDSMPSRLMPLHMKTCLHSELWFEHTFGFKEGPEYECTRRKLRFADNKLKCIASGRSFYVGPFDVVTLHSLKEQLHESSNRSPESYWLAGDLTFQLMQVADMRSLYQDPVNANEVFQVSSNVSCLETKPGRMPEDGVTCYASDRSQGADSALACPAATVFRNYFYKGQGQGSGLGGAPGQLLDCLEKAGEFLHNTAEGYWIIQDGMCVPRTAGKMASLSRRVSNEPPFAEAFRSLVQVGVHWDTEVEPAQHRVCQVFCFGLPIKCLMAGRSADWAGFAMLVLEAAYEATLSAAAILATKRGKRVKVFLTPLGIEWENKREWIAAALDRALSAFQDEPLDVYLLRLEETADEHFQQLEKGRRRFGEACAVKETKRPLMPHPRKNLSVSTDLEALEEALLPTPSCGAVAIGLVQRSSPESERNGAVSKQLQSLFSMFDSDGNGEIDRKEFSEVLRMADAKFFTPPVIAALMSEIDTDASGTINYKEFIAWIFNEDRELLSHIDPRAVRLAQDGGEKKHLLS